ncbi:unnamed protein product [Trichogramma brassicae]|uniref:Uncharacterized protein n=1 Tax=Trichogramma brassicae TaxID=86971 RepID=A0A6H5I2G8_9HYME|nr:unnamed protein product [Trichogramma brassicae]
MVEAAYEHCEPRRDRVGRTWRQRGAVAEAAAAAAEPARAAAIFPYLQSAADFDESLVCKKINTGHSLTPARSALHPSSTHRIQLISAYNTSIHAIDHIHMRETHERTFFPC